MDYQTYIFVLMQLCLLLTIIIASLRLTLPRTVKGTGTWALACLAFIFTAVTLLSLPDVSPVLLLLFANTAYLATVILQVHAIRRHLLHRFPSWQQCVSQIMTSFIPVAALTLVFPNQPARVAMLMILTIGYYAVAVRCLLADGRARKALGGRIILAAFIGAIGIATVRMWAELISLLTPAGNVADTSWFREPYIMAFSGSVVCSSLGFMLLATDKLRIMYERLAVHDPLTGLLSRRGLVEMSEFELLRQHQHGQVIAAVICRIEHFDELGFRYGNGAAEAALVTLAQTIRQHTHETDLAGRYGHCELIMLFPAGLDDAQYKIQQIQTDIQNIWIEARALRFQFAISTAMEALQPGVQVFEHVHQRLLARLQPEPVHENAVLVSIKANGEADTVRVEQVLRD